MTTGDIATWVIGLIVLVIFLFGLKRIYHNFASGKCDSCGTGSDACSGSCHCHCCETDKKSTLPKDTK